MITDYKYCRYKFRPLLSRRGIAALSRAMAKYLPIFSHEELKVSLTVIGTAKTARTYIASSTSPFEEVSGRGLLS